MSLTRFLFAAGLFGGSAYMTNKTLQLTAESEKSKKVDRMEMSLNELPSREKIVNRLKKEEFDVLVIGGGATGLGAALDCATRGLSCALVERNDFSSGTSGRSTKLIHGGMRYLEKAFLNLDYEQYELVKEALYERKYFFDAAPHLARPLPIILPFYQSYPAALFYMPYYWIGCKMYDLVAGEHKLDPSYFLTRREALEKFPMLKREGLKGGVVYYDGQQNDTRTAIAVAQTALGYGAAAANYIEVVSLIKENEKIKGARVRDTFSGEEWDVRSKTVVNATGPFTDSIRLMDDPSLKKIIAPSSGVHIMLSDNYSPEGMGLIAPSSDGRVLFLLPWENGTIAGTTDSSTELTALPKPHEDEINFILKEVSKFLDKNVKREDVDAAWSGIRPLAKDLSKAGGKTEAISRNHVVEVSKSGMVTIAGGKWTTFRLMAEHTIDKLVKENKELQIAKPCVTADVKLFGSHGWSLATSSMLLRAGMSENVAKHLSHNYGDKGEHVAKLANTENLGKKLVHGYPFIEAEVLYGVRHEYAMTAVDILSRRLRLAYVHRDLAVKALPRVIELMGNELKWDMKRRVAEYSNAITFLSTMGRKVPGRHEIEVLKDVQIFDRVNTVLSKQLSTSFLEKYKKQFEKLDDAKNGHILRSTAYSALNNSVSTTGLEEKNIEDNWMELEEFLILSASKNL